MGKFVAGISLENRRVSCVIGEEYINSDNVTSIKIISGSSKENDVRLLNKGWPNNMSLIKQLVFAAVYDAERLAEKKLNSQDGQNVSKQGKRAKDGHKEKEDLSSDEEAISVKADSIFLSVHGSDFLLIEGRAEEDFGTSTKITREVLQDLFEKSLAPWLKQNHNTSILHILPKKFSPKDSSREMQSPLEMSFSSMTCDYIAVGASDDALNNINIAVQNSDLANIEKTFYAPVVIGEYLLSSLEKSNGVLLFDMGRLSSTMSLYKNGVLLMCKELDVGGDTLTMNIQEYLNQYQNTGHEFSFEDAESIKIERAAVHPDLAMNKGNQKTKTDNGEITDKDIIENCIALHLREVLNVFMQFYNAFIKEHKVNFKIPAIVLTGGASNIKGLQNLVKQMFGSNAVRTGIPFPQGKGLDCQVKIDCPKEYRTMDYLAACATLNYAYNAPAQNDIYSWNEDDSTGNPIIDFFVNLFNRSIGRILPGGSKKGKS